MVIKDVLLPLVGEPSAAAIEKCTAVAGNIGARVTAMVVEQDVLVRPKVAISCDLEIRRPDLEPAAVGEDCRQKRESHRIALVRG